MKTLVNTINCDILDIGVTGFDESDSVLHLLLLKNEKCALLVRVIDNQNYITYSFQDEDKHRVSIVFEKWLYSLLTDEEWVCKLSRHILFRQKHNERVYERLLGDSLLIIDSYYKTNRSEEK